MPSPTPRPSARTRFATFAPLAALLAVALGAPGLVGCVEKPTMRLNHAEVSGIRLSFPPSLGILMTVVVDVHNPNGYDVAVRAVRGRVLLADRFELPVNYKADGNGVWLPADTTTTVRVPVTIPAEMAYAVLQQAVASPMIPYRFTGRADVTATSTFELEEDDYAVDERGSVSRKQVEDVIRGLF